MSDASNEIQSTGSSAKKNNNSCIDCWNGLIINIKGYDNVAKIKFDFNTLMFG